MACALAMAGCVKDMDQSAPVQSDYLVIEAACAPATKTDMTQGQSAWEEGDKITVVYDGTAYEYVASAAGETTTFTSAAGISNYDASKSIVAYYPVTDAAGTVKIEAEKSVTFKGAEQVNSACAPLVGTPKDDNLKGGSLSMVFENIFSVLELRIDAGELTGTAKSVTVAPASTEGFSGYLSVSGTVDPATLAVTAASTGNSVKVNLPANADPKKALTVKIPVGRFTSTDGLKVTYETSEGSFDRVVYKSGVSSFEEKDGKFSVMHLAKPMYAFEASAGGIATAADLMEFAAAVNAGENIAKWMNDKGVITLMNDIDMASVTNWTPIGNGKFSGSVSGNNQHVSSYTGAAFTGVFDGQNHSIKNLKLVADLSADQTAYGLFGILDGATVKNLTIGAEQGDASELSFHSANGSDAGVIAGVAMHSTIENCVNYAPMHVRGSGVDNVRVTMGAFAGFVYADEVKGGSVLKGLVNYGSIKVDGDKNTKNGATSVMGAGIAGLTNGTTNISAARNLVKDCINYGNMESSMPRTSGIVAAINQYTDVESCKNYGNQINSNSGTRVGMISAVMSNYTSLKDCENHGDAIMTGGASAQVGGLICLINAATASISGGGNYGKIIGDMPSNSYKGTLVANFSNFKSVDGVVAGGGVGLYNGGDYQMETITSENYMSYIGKYAAGKAELITNITFVAE